MSTTAMPEWEEQKQLLHERIVRELDLSGEVSDEMIGKVIDNCLMDETNLSGFSLADKIRMRTELFNSLRRLDVLTELLSDPSVTEVMVNGCDDIYVEREGCLVKTDKHFSSEEKLRAVIQQIVAKCNRRINDAEPIVDARLTDGSRVNIVLPPVSLSGPVITVRRFLAITFMLPPIRQ